MQEHFCSVKKNRLKKGLDIIIMSLLYNSKCLMVTLASNYMIEQHFWSLWSGDLALPSLPPPSETTEGELGGVVGEEAEALVVES